MSNKQNDIIAENIYENGYCECKSSSVRCPGDIKTLRCDYCGLPTYAVWLLLLEDLGICPCGNETSGSVCEECI